MHRLVLIPALALCLLLVTPAAQAGLGGWAKTAITYVVKDKKVKKEARYGAQAWNKAHVGFRFVPFKGKGEPDLIIANSHHCGGFGDYPAGGTDQLRAQIADASDCPGNRWKTVAVHELGHNLGLVHVKGSCQLMSPTAYACSPLKPGQADKKKVRKFAKQLKRAKKAAPDQPKVEITETKYEAVTEYDEAAGKDFPTGTYQLEIQMKITASWARTEWTDPRIVLSGPIPTRSITVEFWDLSFGPNSIGNVWSRVGKVKPYNMTPGTYTAYAQATEEGAGAVLRSAPVTFVVP